MNENKSQMAELVESVVHSHRPTLLRDGRVHRDLTKKETNSKILKLKGKKIYKKIFSVFLWKSDQQTTTPEVQKYLVNISK